MNFETEMHENLKKVLRLPDEPVAQTASGMALMYEEPFARIKREAEYFLHAICNGKMPDSVSTQTATWLMMAFTKHLWERQELMRQAFDAYMNSNVQPLMIPLPDPSEGILIKNLVAEAIGSQDVRFDAPAVEAVKAVVKAYKKLQQDQRRTEQWG